MPVNPLDLLKKAWGAATTPLVPEGAIAPIQDAIDHPTLNRQPWQARIQGFEAGALEGLRQQTDPLSLAGFASMLPIGKLMGGAGKGVKAAQGILEGPLPHVNMPADIAAAGAEDVYNAGRQLPSRVQTVYDMVKDRMGGRGKP